jgi:hypothetical protein
MLLRRLVEREDRIGEMFVHHINREEEGQLPLTDLCLNRDMGSAGDGEGVRGRQW